MQDLGVSKLCKTGCLALDILNNLEDDIKTVIDASVPNKIQNRAALKMSGDYFFRARTDLCEFAE